MNCTVDVAIVGYGPAGAMLANLLGLSGLRVAVFDKEQAIYPLPRAIHFDGEIMRGFQSIQLRTEVESIARPGKSGMHFVNEQGQTMLIRGGSALDGPHGCANNYYFHQPELEQVLRQGLQRFATVTTYVSQEVTSITEQSDCVLLSVVDKQTQQSWSLTARYVVGCDGARSMVRKYLGSKMLDLGLHQEWLVFDVLLGESAPSLPDYTVQYCDPKRPMTYCNVTQNRRRWEIMVMPGDNPHTMTEPDYLWQLVKPWITPNQASIERAVIYTFHSLIAEGWRQGRVLIAGDAAHQTPPFLGQGMCAAMRDVINLAWKLNAVVTHQASDTLLDTYEAERRPHVHEFVALAVRLGNIIQTTNPIEAQQRDAQFLSGDGAAIFELPSPQITMGLSQEYMPCIGRPIPQFTLSNQQRLDDIVGQHFALLISESALAQVDADMRRDWQNRLVMVQSAEGSVAQQWLDTQQCCAVVIRPDRYVFGIAKSIADVPPLLNHLSHLPTL